MPKPGHSVSFFLLPAGPEETDPSVPSPVSCVSVCRHAFCRDNNGLHL